MYKVEINPRKVKRRKLIRQVLDNGGMICGGYPRSLGAPRWKRKWHSDIDVYTQEKDPRSLDRILEEHGYRLWKRTLEDTPYLQLKFIENIYTYVTTNDIPIQVIICNYSSIEEILESFDWSVCKVSLTSLSELSYLNEQSYNDEKEAAIRYRKMESLSSWAGFRLAKYMQLGYKISEKELLKVFSYVESDQKESFLRCLLHHPIMLTKLSFNEKIKKKFPAFYSTVKILGYEI